MRRPAFILVLPVFLSLVWTGAIFAQSTRSVIGGGVVLESYRFSNPAAAGLESLSLLTVPVAFRVPVSRFAALDFGAAFARGSLTRADGSTSELAGLTDTQVTLSAVVVPDRLTLGVVALLPTGKQKVTDEEAEVAGAVSADLLPLRISNWSTGGGIGLSTSLVQSAGAVTLGVAASYVVGREFDLLESTDFAYRPGNQLVVRGLLAAPVGVAGKLELQVTLQNASEDRVNGSNLYRPGNRLMGMASYSFRAGPTSSALLYAGTFHRSEGTYLLEASNAAASEDLWLAGGGLRMPVGSLVLQPSVDLRIVRRGNGLDQGYSLGVGGSAEWRRSQGLTLLPLVRGRFGTVRVSEGIETGFTGLDAGLIVRFGSRQ
jgi:hypothetical protein